MTKDNIRNIIYNHLKHYQPERVGIFGSFARSENSPHSDIDLLVKFKETLSLLEILRIENDLSEKLGTKVDLVTEDSVQNSKLREYINRDLIMLINNE